MALRPLRPWLMLSCSARFVNIRLYCWEGRTGAPRFPLRPHRKPSKGSTKPGKGDQRENRVNSGSISKVQSGHGGISKRRFVFENTFNALVSTPAGQRRTLKQLSYVIQKRSDRITNNR